MRYLALLLLSLTLAAAPGWSAPLPAFHETVTTPHWQWVDRHAGGTIKALFITSFLSTREAEELAQRFDVEVEVVPVTANPSAIPEGYDTTFLTNALADGPDVIFVAYRGAWGKLSGEALAALVAAVAGGTPLIALSPSGGAKAFLREPAESLAREAEGAVGRNLPVKRLQFPWGGQGGQLKLTVHRNGEGRFVSVSMGHGAGGWFNAFIPSDGDPPALPAKYEIAYAVFGRLTRWAAGKSSGQTCCLETGSAPVLGVPLAVKAALGTPAASPLSLEWELMSPFGERVAAGVEGIAAGKATAEFSVPLASGGDVSIVYRIRQDGLVTDYGALAVVVPPPFTISALRVPELVEPGQAVPVEWSVDGTAEEDPTFLIQVFDADDRLVSRRRCEAGARHCRLDAWQSLGASHCLRMLALGPDGEFLDERRVPLRVRIDRSRDPARYHVMAWATERGATQEQWRYRRLRQLGITAISSVGRGMVVPEMAAAAGLRLAPVNVCVPPNRFKKQFDPVAEKEALDAYARAMAPLSPLGYSLADEPDTASPWRFRDWAAEIAHRQDAALPIGYCGMKVGVGKNIPRIMASCDFLILYSPHHLYSPDMWMGVEREFHRSFARDDAIRACYTHYAPWADHEPYSRTVPWLFLFEGNNAISYFATAGGNFSILPADLRTTHETRWWSEEVGELQRGVATQLIAMRRDRGGIAVLFPTDIPRQFADLAARAVNTWAEALRELNMPYAFVARTGLDALRPDTTPLLICPAAAILTAAELSAIGRYVEGGGTLLASAPFALYEPAIAEKEGPDFWQVQPKAAAPAPPQASGVLEAPGDDADLEDLLGDDEPVEEEPARKDDSVLDIESICGLRRGLGDTLDRQALFDAIALRAGIPCKVAWMTTREGPAIELEGRTAGRQGLAAAGAEACGTFLGKPDDAPGFVSEALSSPAAFRCRRGGGVAYYLNFTPTPTSARTLAQLFRARTGAAPPPAEVTIGDASAPATYLYPFQGGGVRALGIIQDYVRVKPSHENTDKQTALYYHHGPHRWEARDVRLTLPGACHVYDMRRKEYVGHTDVADLHLRPGEPQLLALLPYRVRSVEVEAPTAAVAGASIPLGIEVVGEGAPIGGHVVHVRLQQDEEPYRLGYAGDVMLEGGAGSLRVPTALSDPPGNWTIQVSDTLSGTQTKRTLKLDAATDTGPLFTPRAVDVTRVALDWAQGDWQPYVEQAAGDLTSVQVSVGKVARKRINYGQFNGKYCLRAKTLLELKGRAAEYRFTYFACNDWAAFSWDDKSRVKAYALSGLGMNRPAGHLWYYNGYIDILYDKERVTGHRIADVRRVGAGRHGRVDVTWESPVGDAVLSFGLALEGDALLQRLLVRPRVPIDTVTVRFRSYAGGFGKTSTRYIRTAAGEHSFNPGIDVDPAGRPWAFYADGVLDLAYGRGMGAGGILAMPGDWDRVHYGLNGVLEKRVDLQPGQTASGRWALWLYDGLKNDDAFDAFVRGMGPAVSALGSFFVDAADGP